MSVRLQRTMWFLVLARFAFLVMFVLCIAALVANDVAIFVIVSLFALTGGYCMSAFFALSVFGGMCVLFAIVCFLRSIHRMLTSLFLLCLCVRRFDLYLWAGHCGLA